jgi:hypothetical protein
MPMFVKMGLNGKGFMGKKESHLRSERKRKARRAVLPGYPINTPFENMYEVQKYLSGDRITCLLCGKEYKKLGNHLLKIHGVTVDEYKEKYQIPWTYSLATIETQEAYRAATLKRIADGFEPPKKTGIDQEKMILAKKRTCPHKKEISINNLGDEAKPKHETTVGPDGKPETFTARRERLRSKIGSNEYRKKMLSRPQCQPDVVGKRLGDYWRGREQTDEHVYKRTGYHKKT